MTHHRPLGKDDGSGVLPTTRTGNEWVIGLHRSEKGIATGRQVGKEVGTRHTPQVGGRQVRWVGRQLGRQVGR